MPLRPERSSCQVCLAWPTDTHAWSLAGELERPVVVERPPHDVFDFLAVSGFERVSHAANTSFGRTHGCVKRERRHDVPGEAAQLIDAARDREQHVGYAGIMQRLNHAREFNGGAV